MTSTANPLLEYERRLADARVLDQRGERTHLALSNGRLAIFAAFAILAWAAMVRHMVTAWWLLGPAGAFAVLVVVHAVWLNRLDRIRRVIAFYTSGVARIEDRWLGTARNGAEFGKDHPYGADLDLFGPGSLFELLNTTRTEAGEFTLASWLGAPADLDEVRARQAAVAELAAKPDFREDVAILAAEAHVARTGALAAWVATAQVGFSAAARLGLTVCTVVSAAVTAAVLADRMDSAALLVWFSLQAAIAATCRRRVKLVLGRIGIPARDLSHVAWLLARVEQEAFVSPRLAALKAELGASGAPPSRRIAQLQRLVSFLDSTSNQIFAPIAAALLVRTHVALAIDRWHGAYGGHVAAWLRVAGELEALTALGTFHFEHPDDRFPAMSANGPLFRAVSLGHPLIPVRSTVRNDIALGGAAPSVLVVSGSNMSGKSTLLRAVGVNVVLALAGAPVRAAALELSRLAIGATLRVEDSLREGRSRFYAEILRIRSIMDLTHGETPVMFLLDEILHGTNSYDRRIGAEAIVRSLVERGAIGLVTTHDLALTALVDTMGGRAANVHFEDRLEEGRMTFDYRMRSGIVEHSNALALMRAIGLEV